MVGRGIILILAISILLLGCCAVPGGGPTGETGTAGTGGGIAGGTGATGGETGGTGTTGGETGGTGTNGGQTGGTTTGGNDLLGKSYEELAALGIPIQCDMTMTYQGQVTTVRVYMKNQDEVRNEIPTQQSGICDKMVSIMKGNTVYSGCEGEKYPPGTSCDWLKFVMAESEPTDATDTGPPDYSDVPPAQISCMPWVPDESKFATPGKVCTQEDIVNEMMNQYN